MEVYKSLLHSVSTSIIVELPFLNLLVLLMAQFLVFLDRLYQLLRLDMISSLLSPPQLVLKILRFFVQAVILSHLWLKTIRDHVVVLSFVHKELLEDFLCPWKLLRVIYTSLVLNPLDPLLLLLLKHLLNCRVIARWAFWLFLAVQLGNWP